MELSSQPPVPLAQLTTLGVGGKPQFYLPFEHNRQVQAALRLAAQHALPTWVLGGGSNVLAQDAPLPVCVLHAVGQQMVCREHNGVLEVEAQAGVAWDKLVRCAVQHGCADVAMLSGIPGTCGAAPIQNIGAYGAAAADFLQEVRGVTHTGQLFARPASSLALGYRTSALKTGHLKGVVTWTRWRFAVGPARCCYADIRAHLIACGLSPDAKHPAAVLRQAVLTVRGHKGMLGCDHLGQYASAGSFFLNMHLCQKRFAALQQRLTALGAARVPHYPDANLGHKISAAWLIEQVGFYRGYRRGLAALSPRHALSVIALPGARAQHIWLLAQHVMQRVQDMLAVQLIPEPQIWFAQQPAQIK